MERTYQYTTSDGHTVTYYISRRGHFLMGCYGAQTMEGIEAAEREVWQALKTYRLNNHTALSSGH